jgi:hypothetical protein
MKRGYKSSTCSHTLKTVIKAIIFLGRCVTIKPWLYFSSSSKLQGIEAHVAQSVKSSLCGNSGFCRRFGREIGYYLSFA